MRGTKVYAVLIAMLLIVSISIVAFNGCDNGSINPNEQGQLKQMPPEPRAEGLEGNGCYEFETEDTDGNVYQVTLYTYEHATGREKIDRFAGDSKHVGDVQLLLADNYMLDHSRCKHIQTTTVEGIPFETRTLIFVQDVGPDQESYAIMRYACAQGVAETYQIEKMFYGNNVFDYWTDGGYVATVGVDEFGRTIWSQSFEPVIRQFVNDATCAPVADPPPDDPTLDPEAWDWKLWAKCVAESAGTGCAAGHGTCLFSPDVYDNCVEDQCGRALVAAVIGCSADQIW